MFDCRLIVLVARLRFSEVTGIIVSGIVITGVIVPGVLLLSDSPLWNPEQESGHISTDCCRKGQAVNIIMGVCLDEHNAICEESSRSSLRSPRKKRY